MLKQCFLIEIWIEIIVAMQEIIEVLYTLYLVSSNGNILQNCSIMSQPEY